MNELGEITVELDVEHLIAFFKRYQNLPTKIKKQIKTISDIDLLPLFNEKFKEIEKQGEIVKTVKMSNYMWNLYNMSNKDKNIRGRILWTANIVIDDNTNNKVLFIGDKE